MRYAVPVLMCLMILSCQRSSYYELDSWAKSYVPPKNQSADSDDDIRESVFRYQIHHNDSYQKDQAHGFYLAIAGGDPSDEFMVRFARNETPIQKASACERTSDTPLGVHDKQSGLPGIILEIDALNRIGDKEAEVTGGYFEGGLSASSNVYHVKFKNGAWVVTSVEGKSIS